MAACLLSSEKTTACRDRGREALNGLSVRAGSCRCACPSEVAARGLILRCSSLPVGKLFELTRLSPWALTCLEAWIESRFEP